MSPDRLRTRLWLVGAVVTLVVAAGIPARATIGARTTADEPHYLLTAISLWEDHDLDYGDEREELRYLPFHEVLLPVQAAHRDDGQRLAPHEPLLPLVLAAPTVLGGWVAAKATMAVLAGVLAATTAWFLERRQRVRPAVAAGAALIAGCSPPLVIYGTQIYPELAGALVVLCGYAAATAATPGRLARWGGVVAVAALPWLNVKYVPVAGVLGVAVLLGARRTGGSRRALAPAAVLAAAAVSFAVFHQRVYGGWTAYAAGSHFAGGELTVMGDDPDYVGRTPRLLGLLVDRDFGLAAWQPLALLAVPAVVAWCLRRDRCAWWVLPATVAAGWLTATYMALTIHGWWWPGRQTVVVVPLLVVATATMVDGWSVAAQRVTAAVGAFGIWAYAWLVGGVLAGAHTLIFDFDRTADPVGWLWRRALPDRRAGTLVDDVLFAGWIVATAVTVTAIIASAAIASRRRAPVAPNVGIAA